ITQSLDPREQLEWEKELIGLYVSDHPMTPYLAMLRGKVTHSSGELSEAANKDKVVVAGLVTRMRTLTTKNGKGMAFATIEDIQGPIELVLFPKTWERFAPFVRQDNVILVEGKVDAEGGDPKILVDLIKPLTTDDLNAAPPPLPNRPAVETPAPKPVIKESKPVPDYHTRPIGDTPSDLPPMPEEPDDWHMQEPSGFSSESGTITPIMEPLDQPNPIFTPQDEPRMIIAPPVEKPKSLQFAPDPQVLESFVAKVIPPLILPIEPRASKVVTEKGTTRMLTIIMRSSEDKGRDIRRLKRICGMVRSSPGNDRFCFLIFENSHRHLLDFPNDTIGI
ncbi:hypothetical protein FDZ74_17775, partial [bacterium]